MGEGCVCGAHPGQPLRSVTDASRSLVTGMTRDEVVLMVYLDCPELRCGQEWRIGCF